MMMYLVRRWYACRRKAAALREIRRNGWRSPWLGEDHRDPNWKTVNR